MEHVEKKKLQMDVVYRTKRVKEEIKQIMPTVLETKGTFIFISVNMRGTKQYLSNSCSIYTALEEKVVPYSGSGFYPLPSKDTTSTPLFESDFSAHAQIQSPKHCISGDKFYSQSATNEPKEFLWKFYCL